MTTSDSPTGGSSPLSMSRQEFAEKWGIESDADWQNLITQFDGIQSDGTVDETQADGQLTEEELGLIDIELTNIWGGQLNNIFGD